MRSISPPKKMKSVFSWIIFNNVRGDTIHPVQASSDTNLEDMRAFPPIKNKNKNHASVREGFFSKKGPSLQAVGEQLAEYIERIRAHRYPMSSNKYL